MRTKKDIVSRNYWYNPGARVGERERPGQGARQTSHFQAHKVIF